jgi:cytochrome c-type biogenesis protein CcmH
MILGFVIIAGSLAALVAAMLLVPLVKRREDARPTASIAAVVVLFGLLFGAGALYVAFSNYTWSTTQALAETPAAKAAELARKLADKSDDLQGWLQLGRAYQELGQMPLAIRAYQRADRLANNTNADAVLGMAESLAMQDPAQIEGVAGRLFERALEIDPRSQKALFFSGYAAMQRGELPRARERFMALLGSNPPDNVRPLLEKQIERIDELLASAAAGHAAGAGQGATPAAGDPAARISVRVSLAPALRAKVAANAPLFVLARDPNQPGPPFAVKRMAAQFPVEVELTPADAMLAERRISVGQTLEVVARVALGGTPVGASGDPFGQVSYHVGKDKRLEIVVDRLTP